MKKVLITFCLFFFVQINAFSQTVYVLDLKKDLILGTLSLGMGIVPFFVNNEPDYVHGILNKNEINSFDRCFMFSYKKYFDLISDYTAYGLALLPVISMIPNIKHKNTVLTYGIMYSEAVLLTVGTAFTLKRAINRYRPYMYDNGIPDGKERDFHNSFPSGSTSFAFLSSTFLSVTFSKEYPESKWKLPVILGSYTLATGIASMRIYSGSHFVTDVFIGAVIGSLYGGLIPLLHSKNNNHELALVPAGNGITVSLRF